jgi:hypothetical protein
MVYGWLKYLVLLHFRFRATSMTSSEFVGRMPQEINFIRLLLEGRSSVEAAGM